MQLSKFKNRNGWGNAHAIHYYKTFDFNMLNIKPIYKWKGQMQMHCAIMHNDVKVDRS